MNLSLDSEGALSYGWDAVKRQFVFQPPLEIPPVPEGVSEGAWKWLHHCFQATDKCIKYLCPDGEHLTVFQMTEEQRLGVARMLDISWAEQEEEDRRQERKSERDIFLIS